ncbi:MAG TPA: 6-bladed beta-propeller [Gallionella sp.]|nr:6-bladed beta-propeller [Gallionella sp.]
MTKRPLVYFFAAVIALVGCTMSGPGKVAGKKVPDNLTFPPPPDEPRFYFERSVHSSSDVKPDTDTDALRRALTGERVFGIGITKPYSVAVNHGRLFVGDTVHRDVKVFDFPERKFFQIGEDEDEQGNGKLELPLGIDVDKQGNLYVFDGKLKQILVYNRDGKFLRYIGNPDDFVKPAGIAVNPEGTRIYAVDIGGSSSDQHKVLVYDAKSGAHLFDIGKRGIGDGEFNLPRDATIAPDGSVYVVDGGNFRVEKFSADGKFISTFGSIGRQMGQFSRPKEAAVDKDGNVYVVDAAFGNFQIFNSKGELLLAIGNRSNTDGPAKFSLPSSIAVDDDGRVYVVDQYFRKVDIFRPAALAEEDGYIGKNAIDKYQKTEGEGSPATDKVAPAKPAKVEAPAEPGKDEEIDPSK